MKILCSLWKTQIFCVLYDKNPLCSLCVCSLWWPPYVSCYAQKRNCKMKRIFNFHSRLFYNIHKKMHCFLLTTNKNSNLVWTICRECNKENVLIFDKIPYIFHAILLFRGNISCLSYLCLYFTIRLSLFFFLLTLYSQLKWMMKAQEHWA